MLTNPINIIVVCNPTRGFAVCQKGDSFEISFESFELACLFKSWASTQFEFPDGLLIGEIKRSLIFWQVNVQTVDWEPESKDRFLNYDFSKENLRSF